jgi:omega-amidase
VRDLNVTLVQMDLAWHDREKNLSRLDGLLAPLAGATDLVVLPEMFSTGFTMKPEECAEAPGGETTAWMLSTAKALRADCAGSVAMREGGSYYNRLLWARPDGTLLAYDKRHLFRMGGEDRVYRPGARLLTVELHGWRLRPFICYDLRFPAWTRSRGPGYEAALFVANWPAPRAAHWNALLRARAIENLSYVVGVNRAGVDGKGIAYNGDSSVIDFAGNALFAAGPDECVRTVSLSRAALESYRESFPAWKDADAFTLDAP